jgi:WD40 repeat protein
MKTHIQIYMLAICFFQMATPNLLAQKTISLKPDKPLGRYYSENETYHSITYSRDGRFLIGRTPLRVTVWNAKDLSEVYSHEIETNQSSNSIQPAVISSDGSVIAIITEIEDDGRRKSVVLMINLKNGLIEKTIPLVPFESYAGGGLAFNDDASVIAVSDTRENYCNVGLYDTKTAKFIGRIHVFDKKFNTMCFLPGTNHIATGGVDSDGSTIKVWDIKTKKLVSSSRWQKERVQDLATSNDGKFLYSTSSDKTLKIFDVTEDKLLVKGTIQLKRDYFLNVSVSSDASRICTVESNEFLNVWDGDTYELLLNIKLPDMTSFSFSPDGKHLALTLKYRSKHPMIINLEEFMHRTVPSNKYLVVINNYPLHVEAFSRDGKKLALEMDYYPYDNCGKKLLIWNLKSESIQSRLLKYKDKSIKIWSVNSDMHAFFTKENDPNIYEWNSSKNEFSRFIRLPKKTRIEYFAFAFDGKTLGVSTSNNYFV